MEAAAHLEAINNEQKATSPMGAPRMVRLGVQDLFISEGNKLRSHRLKSSHLNDAPVRDLNPEEDVPHAGQRKMDQPPPHHPGTKH